MGIEIFEKITAYPNEAIHDDCVVAFTGAYEKIASETKPKSYVDKWIPLNVNKKDCERVSSIKELDNLGYAFME